MPAHVRAGQIIGLVEVTGGLGSPIDASQLAHEFGYDIATLLPILDTGEMLGLVKIEKGGVSLTEFGVKFQKTSKHKIRLVKDIIAKIEPFRTALELARHKGSITSRDVTGALRRTDIRWHHVDELNESLIQDLLIHWAIYAGLLSYDGKKGKFHKT